MEFENPSGRKNSEKPVRNRLYRKKKRGEDPPRLARESSKFACLGELLQDYRPNRESSDFVSEEPEETVVKPLSSVPNQSVTCVHFLFTRWENNKSFLSLKSLFVRFRKIRAKISGRFSMISENISRIFSRNFFSKFFGGM